VNALSVELVHIQSCSATKGNTFLLASATKREQTRPRDPSSKDLKRSVYGVARQKAFDNSGGAAQSSADRIQPFRRLESSMIRSCQ